MCSFLLECCLFIRIVIDLKHVFLYYVDISFKSQYRKNVILCSHLGEFLDYNKQNIMFYLRYTVSLTKEG